jgi:hypothetical protein
MERSGHHCRWTFSKDSPGPCAVDRFPVDLKPGTNVSQHLLNFGWNCSVGARPYIQEQIPVLTDNVYQLMNDKFGRLERVIFDITPGFIADGGVLCQ